MYFDVTWIGRWLDLLDISLRCSSWSLDRLASRGLEILNGLRARHTWTFELLSENNESMHISCELPILRKISNRFYTYMLLLTFTPNCLIVLNCVSDSLCCLLIAVPNKVPLLPSSHSTWSWTCRCLVTLPRCSLGWHLLLNLWLYRSLLFPSPSASWHHFSIFVRNLQAIMRTTIIYTVPELDPMVVLSDFLFSINEQKSLIT